MLCSCRAFVTPYLYKRVVGVLCRVDEFIIECQDLGTLSRLMIWHDNSGEYPGWFLEKVVVVEDFVTSRVYEFPCDRWLAKDKDDGHISRELSIGTIGAGGTFLRVYSVSSC